MKKLFPYTVATRVTYLKWAGYIFMLIGFITVPEKIVHAVAVFAHYFYEGTSYLLEELVMHLFDLEKFYTQLIVFYISLCTGLIGLYWLARRLPGMIKKLKADFVARSAEIKTQAKEIWQHLPMRQKIYMIVLQFSGIASTFSLLLI